MPQHFHQSLKVSQNWEEKKFVNVPAVWLIRTGPTNTIANRAYWSKRGFETNGSFQNPQLIFNRDYHYMVFNRKLLL